MRTSSMLGLVFGIAVASTAAADTSTEWRLDFEGSAPIAKPPTAFVAGAEWRLDFEGSAPAAKPPTPFAAGPEWRLDFEGSAAKVTP